MTRRTNKLARPGASLTRPQAAWRVVLVYCAVSLGAWALFHHIRSVLDIASTETLHNIRDIRHEQVTTAFVTLMLSLGLASLLRIARRPDPPTARHPEEDPPAPRPAGLSLGARAWRRVVAAVQRAEHHREALFAYGVALGFALAAATSALLAQLTPFTPSSAFVFALLLAFFGGLFCARVLPSLARLPALREPEPPSEDELLLGASRAVRDAIARLHRANIATTHIVDGRLVRVHPDGHREDIGPPSST